VAYAEAVPPESPAQITESIEPRTERALVEPAAPPPAPLPPRERRPAAPLSVQNAIEEVNHIVGTLREALDDMDEVLETLESAERQKDADEHEIESLRRALRQLHRPRDGGPPPHR
jgi:hypothetical protein